MLLNHLHHRFAFHVHHTCVVLQQHCFSGFALCWSEDAHGREELFVLLGGELAHSFNATVYTPDAFLHRGLWPRWIIAVAIENHLPVRLQEVTCNISSFLSGLDPVRDDLEALSREGVQANVDERNILARASSTELKTRPPIWEGAGAVAILCWYLDGSNHAHPEAQLCGLWLVLGRLAIHKLLQVFGHVLAKVSGHHCRRSLTSTETEVVARA
mmetsp:Transcript_79992/g.141152  ORF Transcript_79992/g.141152 Transcript_79992/m.141152 type:complete len:214 (+) Transcript_79992:712-1353(+)